MTRENYTIWGKTYSPEEAVKVIQDHADNIAAKDDSRYQLAEGLLDAAPQRVLDYGCGWGGFTRRVASLGHNVTGIDLSSHDIDLCKITWQEGPNLTFEHKQIDAYGENAFTTVISNQVIEHTHNPGSYLSRINHVLETGGALVITLPNIMNPRYFLPVASPNLAGNLKKISQEMKTDYDKGTHHIQGWDAKHFVRLVSTVGFELEAYTPMEGVPMPFWRFVPAYLRGAFWKKNKYVRDYCYTMGFRFRKYKDVSIGQFD